MGIKPIRWGIIGCGAVYQGSGILNKLVNSDLNELFLNYNNQQILDYV